MIFHGFEESKKAFVIKMNPQQKINDVTYLVRELNIELSKTIAYVSRLEKTKDKLSKHYDELDWEKKEMVHSILVEQQKDEEYQRQLLKRKNKYPHLFNKRSENDA